MVGHVDSATTQLGQGRRRATRADRGSSRSGTSPPNAPDTWASIDPPSRSRPAPRSTSTSAESGTQLRRPRATHVGQRREGRDDERHRRRDLLVLAGRRVGPAGAHRQRVLADRHRDPERGHSSIADGVDGVVERRILAGLAAGRHPVARQLHAAERARPARPAGWSSPRRPPSGRMPARRPTASGMRSPMAIASPAKPTWSASVTASRPRAPARARPSGRGG